MLSTCFGLLRLSWRQAFIWSRQRGRQLRMIHFVKCPYRVSSRPVCFIVESLRLESPLSSGRFLPITLENYSVLTCFGV